MNSFKNILKYNNNKKIYKVEKNSIKNVDYNIKKLDSIEDDDKIKFDFDFNNNNNSNNKKKNKVNYRNFQLETVFVNKEMHIFYCSPDKLNLKSNFTFNWNKFFININYNKILLDDKINFEKNKKHNIQNFKESNSSNLNFNKYSNATKEISILTIEKDAKSKISFMDSLKMSIFNYKKNEKYNLDRSWLKEFNFEKNDHPLNHVLLNLKKKVCNKMIEIDDNLLKFNI